MFQLITNFVLWTPSLREILGDCLALARSAKALELPDDMDTLSMSKAPPPVCGAIEGGVRVPVTALDRRPAMSSKGEGKAPIAGLRAADGRRCIALKSLGLKRTPVVDIWRSLGINEGSSSGGGGSIIDGFRPPAARDDARGGMGGLSTRLFGCDAPSSTLRYDHDEYLYIYFKKIVR